MEKDSLDALINETELKNNKKNTSHGKIETDLVFAADSFRVQYSSLHIFMYEDLF